MHTLYVAFSINGTNSFITASRVIPDTARNAVLADLATQGFTVEPSRREDFDGKKETKLRWSKLSAKKNGQPLRSPPVILSRFKELHTSGWTVNNAAFIYTHWKKPHEKIWECPYCGKEVPENTGHCGESSGHMQQVTRREHER